MKSKDFYLIITLISALIFILVTGNNLVYMFFRLDFWQLYCTSVMASSEARFWTMIFSWAVSGDLTLLSWTFLKISKLEEAYQKI